MYDAGSDPLDRKIVNIVRWISECDCIPVPGQQGVSYRSAVEYLRVNLDVDNGNDFDLIDPETGRFISWVL